MPIYEYHCSKCGVFEVTQRITEDPLKKCPTCHHKVQKLISNTSFQLKGSGWYITDYGRGSGTSADKRDGDSKANDGDSKANGKSKSSDSSKKASTTEKSSAEKSTPSTTPSS